ncbi:MAG: hypothetical protein J5956_07955 [Ruminococcus sp.]|nr:hypothetical protein [Ruminococcus sp.]
MNTPEQAQELENKILGNVNNKTVDNHEKSGIIKMRGEISSNSINWLPKGDTISFEEYKNIREYANQNGFSLQGFKTSDFDVQLVKETIDSAKQVTDVFPELLGNSKRPLTLSLSNSMSNMDLASTDKGIGHIIQLNANAF